MYTKMLDELFRNWLSSFLSVPQVLESRKAHRLRKRTALNVCVETYCASHLL